MFADILGWRRHELVYDITEQSDISLGIAANTGDEFGDCLLVLKRTFKWCHATHKVGILDIYPLD